MTSSSLARLLAAGLGAFALSVGLAAAQDAAPAPASPEPGKPANLCQDLLAFVKQPEPAKQAATTPPQQATAVSNPSGKTEGGKPSGTSETQKTSGLSGTVSENGSKPEAKAAEAKPAEAKPAEVKPVDPKTAATTPNAATNPATDPRARANADAKVPPGPGTPAPGPKPDAATIEKIETAAAANDLAACRAVARSMRVAGVVIPPPLLALSALDLKYFQQ
jgi:hypothetical protein